MYSLITDDTLIKDSIAAQRIIDNLTPQQTKQLDSGETLLNPINGDIIVPMVTQNGIAKMIINIF